MCIFVIHAPRRTVKEGGRTFQQTLLSGIGKGYAITKPLYEQINPGCVVVLLSKDEKRRAEGKLIRLVPTDKTTNHIQMYDVHIDGLKEVEYSTEPLRLNRNGVAVIPCGT